MRTGIRYSMAFAISLAFGPLAVGAEPNTETLDTAVVEATRLSDLRRAVREAEDDFLGLYNKVNTDRRQRMSCADQAPTGSRLSARRCSTHGQDDATQEQARGMLQAMVDSGAYGGPEALRREERAKELETKELAGAPLSAEEQQELRDLKNPTLDHTKDQITGKMDDERSRFEKNLRQLLDKHPELNARYAELMAAKGRLAAAEQRQRPRD